MSDYLDAAMGYAARGWPVFPCHSRIGPACTCGHDDCDSPAKHPRTRNGLKDATTDPVKIRQWFLLSRPPGYTNIAIAAGAASDLLVLDVDPRHGGWKSLRELDRRYRLPDTATVVTGGGGLHLYYRHPGVDIPPSARRLLPGIDVRADRAYIVAPPSIHMSGEQYRWDNNLTAAPCPSWLVRALQPPPPKPRRPVTVTGDHSRYAQAALESAVRNIASAAPGRVHDTLWREAYGIGRIVHGGLLDESVARQALLAALPPSIRSERAAEKTVDAKFAYARSRPRTVAS